MTAVLLTGEGERGLSARGDLRSLYENETAAAEPFWRDEYRLDSRISRYEKPFVAVMDGITMGGGVGLSGHAAHRIVTERSRIAMPETGIGYLPDVGGTWLLPRAPGELGTYLGLTARRSAPRTPSSAAWPMRSSLHRAAGPDRGAWLRRGGGGRPRPHREGPRPAPLAAHRT